MTLVLKSLLLILIAISHCACATTGGVSGNASWYGTKYHGRKTASGEVFNQNSLTAAHPSLPFGTKVKVTNTANGKSVVVRINDRGPFVYGREIDLSYAAAKKIDMIRSGVANVDLDVLDD